MPSELPCLEADDAFDRLASMLLVRVRRIVVGWGLPHQEAGPKEDGGASPTLHITELARQNS